MVPFSSNAREEKMPCSSREARGKSPSGTVCRSQSFPKDANQLKGLSTGCLTVSAPTLIAYNSVIC